MKCLTTLDDFLLLMHWQSILYNVCEEFSVTIEGGKARNYFIKDSTIRGREHLELLPLTIKNLHGLFIPFSNTHLKEKRLTNILLVHSILYQMFRLKNHYFFSPGQSINLKTNSNTRGSKIYCLLDYKQILQ